jgi:hypothetical protein
MFNHTADTAVILGAGFSKESGLPIARDLSAMIFDHRFRGVLEDVVTRAIQEFLVNCFRWRAGDPLPTFEDIFTMIDLAAGTGHSLGCAFTPKKLRAVRRMLVLRLFGILDLHFAPSPNIVKILRTLISRRNTTHFVVLNWDIVLEGYLWRCVPLASVDYCVDISSWFPYDRPRKGNVGIAKIHGSANWVYCDNCHSLFYDPHSKLALHIRAGITKADFRLFDPGITDRIFDRELGASRNGRSCRKCRCAAVGSHIATFSFRKSFRTQGFTSSWLAAEQILTQAKRWIFLGYSLPDADFEFKHLLKTCQLKRIGRDRYPKEITSVILCNPDIEVRYRAFFGSDVVDVITGGIAAYADSL